jgi:acetyl-CoA carboxylase biotin carboxyl carrier protein
VLLPPPITALTDRGDDATGVIVRSSTIGTFYRAIESAGKPLVDVGDTVKAGQLLAVVRALNLINEIKSGCDGRIVKVYVETGHVVQYGDHLFQVRPR